MKISLRSQSLFHFKEKMLFRLSVKLSMWQSWRNDAELLNTHKQQMLIHHISHVSHMWSSRLQKRSMWFSATAQLMKIFTSLNHSIYSADASLSNQQGQYCQTVTSHLEAANEKQHMGICYWRSCRNVGRKGGKEGGEMGSGEGYPLFYLGVSLF